MQDTSQAPLDQIDISILLRRIMAVRKLSVADMAKAAGVSKSAMEKYLAGPSSPRLVAIASLSRALGLSVDQLVFGEIDPHDDLVYQIAFDEIDKLILDLKNEAVLRDAFQAIEPGTKALSDFARDLAYVRAVTLRARFRHERREAHFGTLTLTQS